MAYLHGQAHNYYNIKDSYAKEHYVCMTDHGLWITGGTLVCGGLRFP